MKTIRMMLLALAALALAALALAALALAALALATLALATLAPAVVPHRPAADSDNRITAELCRSANNAEEFLIAINRDALYLEIAKQVLEASRTALALRKQAALRGHPCTSEEE